MSDLDIAAEVIRVPAQQWLFDSYMPYTQYVIRSRALVSVDGLKPVQRRILWQMFRDNIGPDSKHVKAARVAGNTMAFHPHASSSIEDALARMAQDFSLRIPLVDAHGSVGFVSGDTPAAARYWEARLTKEAVELLREIKEGGAVMGKNFDGELDEPIKLPVRWPVALINGTQGIAVGYASDMYSHNPSEIIDGARAILKNPSITLDKLMKLIPGPDMPTGGELIGVDGVKEYMETGSGSFIIRGKYRLEPMTRGKMKIIFYELPYQVSAEKVKVKIQSAQQLGKFKEIASVKDLTDMKNGLKLVIETKAGTNHLSVLQQLFKETPIEEKFSVNATVLVDGRPVKRSMIAMLQDFIELRRSVTTRKANNRLEKIASRIHQLEGILAVLIDIDKAIKIIRGSDTTETAQKKLSTTFKIDSEQADYILGMQLRRLTKQDSLALKSEQKNLIEEKKLLEKVLKDPKALDQLVDEDLVATKKVIGDPRRTTISGVTLEEAKEEAKVAQIAARSVDKNSIVYLTRFADGTIIRTDKHFGYELKEKKLRYSPVREQIKIKSQEKVMLIGSDGIARVVPVSYIASDLISTPAKVGVNMPKGVTLVGIGKLEPLKTDQGIAIGTKQGVVKLVKPEFPKKDEFPVIKLDAGDSIIEAVWIESTLKDTKFYFVSKNSFILVFDAESIRASGATAGGVKGFGLKGDDEAIAFGWASFPKDSLVISQSNKAIKVTDFGEISPKGRGSQGVALQTLEANEKLVKAYIGPRVDLVATMNKVGMLINLPPVSPRARKGVAVPGELDFGTRGMID